MTQNRVHAFIGGYAAGPEKRGCAFIGGVLLLENLGYIDITYSLHYFEITAGTSCILQFPCKVSTLLNGVAPMTYDANG